MVRLSGNGPPQWQWSTSVVMVHLQRHWFTSSGNGPAQRKWFTSVLLALSARLRLYTFKVPNSLIAPHVIGVDLGPRPRRSGVFYNLLVSCLRSSHHNDRSSWAEFAAFFGADEVEGLAFRGFDLCNELPRHHNRGHLINAIQSVHSVPRGLKPAIFLLPLRHD